MYVQPVLLTDILRFQINKFSNTQLLVCVLTNEHDTKQ